MLVIQFIPFDIYNLKQFIPLWIENYMLADYYPGHPYYATITEVEDPEFIRMSQSFGQLATSSITLIDPTLVDYSSDGRSKVRSITTSIRAEITVEHIVNEANKDTLFAFYLTNLNSSFSFHFKLTDTIYTKCVFMEAPKIEYISPGLWKVTNKLGEI